MRGESNIVEAIEGGEIQIVFNVPVGQKAKADDSYIRKAAIKHMVPHITSAEAVVASVEGIKAAMGHRITVKSLQAYRRDLGWGWGVGWVFMLVDKNMM